MKRVNRPYLLNTETLSAWYETLEEAQKQFEYWKQFYIDNNGKYGNDRTITIIKRGRKTDKVIQSVLIP